MPQPPAIESRLADTIRIRPYSTDDVDALFSAVMESKPELSLWMPWCHANYARIDTENWVHGRADDWENDRQWCFVIVDQHGGFLGGCGLHRLDLLNATAELGYWVRSSAAGRGIATAATRLLTDWAFTERDLHRIEILASVENSPSQRVAEKAGFIREGVLHQRLKLHGRWHDCLLSALVKPD